MNARHINRTYTNFLFADGHCESVLTKSVPQINQFPGDNTLRFVLSQAGAALVGAAPGA